MKTANRLTEYRKELKGRILEVAVDEFLKSGIRAVKMDDIARLLGISKRTLYEIYPNKEDILLECIKMRHNEEDQQMATFLQEEPRSPMDIILEFFRMQMNSLASLPPVFLSDINRYPRVLAYLRHRHESRRERTLHFFEKGAEEGFFRNDVDYALITQIADGMMQSAILQHLYKEYDLPYIFRNVLFLFLRGFCTQKGLAALDETLK